MFFRGQGVGTISNCNFRFARGRRIFLISFTPLAIFFPTECPPFLRVEVVILHFGARGQKGAGCFECFSFSGRGLVTSCGGKFRGILCGFCRQTALAPFSTEKIQQKQKSCKSLWHKHFYAENKKARIKGLTRTENTKWGASFHFSFWPARQNVQIAFIQIKSTAKLLPAALFAQNVCSWFNL